MAASAGLPGPGALLFSCLCLFPVAAVAQERNSFDFGDPPETTHPITESLSFGVNLDVKGSLGDNLDLDSGQDDDQGVFEPNLNLAFTFEPDERLRAYLDLDLTRREVGGQSAVDNADLTSLEVLEAYVVLREIAEGTSLQIGRQLFQDPLEWFYDQELDALRAYHRLDAFAVEASISEQGLFDEDLLNEDDTDQVVNYILAAHYLPAEDLNATGYLLHRDAVAAAGEDLTFLGLQSFGALGGDLDYWINAAFVAGSEKSRGAQRDIRGFGVDVLATYRPLLALEPSLTLGLAFATGDGNRDDGIDQAFRQSGLQSNNASFNGVTRFKYFGEVLDPELSNLGILTLGAGFKPSEESSIDLVYHYYWQHHATAGLRSSNLEADPDGRHRELGHGLDLVLGFLEIEDLSAELVLGAFLPGRAFPDSADIATFLSVELEYEF